MKKNKTLLITLAIIVFLGLLSLLGRLLNKPEMILFFGDTCPHCKNVEKYISENKIREVFKFQELEVYNNKANAQLLAQKAKGCGLDTAQGVGVPLFFDGQKCLQGDEAIINFLKTKGGKQ
jgi:predicted DCC family thiol-disulfide oxidoreductase YuxK